MNEHGSSWNRPDDTNKRTTFETAIEQYPLAHAAHIDRGDG